MGKLTFSIPRIDAAMRPSVGTAPKQVRTWLEGLPLVDAEQAARSVLGVLVEFNRTEIEVGARLQILDLLHPVVTQLAPNVRKKFLGSAFPLPPKARERANLVQQLFTEMAYGYKIVVSRAVASGGNGVSQRDSLTAIYFSIDYLAKLLVEHFMIYAPAPSRLWGELNGLYRFAHMQQIHAVPIARVAEQALSIERSYLQVLLLAVVNPYRLMRGEAEKVFALLAQWAPHCRLISPSAGWRPSGELLVDLAEDDSPSHAGTEIDPATLGRLRIINVDELKALIKGHVAQQGGTAKPKTLMERLERDMLTRLVGRWGSKLDRAEQRIDCDEALDMVVGLTACHYVLGGDPNLTPDQDAETLGAESQSGKLSGLSLVSKEDVHWKERNRSTGTLREHQVQASRFKIDDPTRDVWSSDYALGPGEQHAALSVSAHSFTKKDESAGGFALDFAHLDGLSLRVGELVGVHAPKAGKTCWQIGVIRWMQIDRDGSGELGVQRLADSALAFSSKALHGAGQGSDYARGLLIPGEGFDHPEARLLVAASIYDVGSVLYLESCGERLRARLTELLDSSDTFACFRFTRVVGE